ncbi:hypothetical protein TMatcc_004051 [Talaromyces marneffei ATCC 18224]
MAEAAVAQAYLHVHDDRQANDVPSTLSSPTSSLYPATIGRRFPSILLYILRLLRTYFRPLSFYTRSGGSGPDSVYIF